MGCSCVATGAVEFVCMKIDPYMLVHYDRSTTTGHAPPFRQTTC